MENSTPMAAGRLRRGADIRAVFDHGARAGGGAASVFLHVRGDGCPARVAVVAGRKVGGAVERNRAKRRLRAVLAAIPLPVGHDLVVVARPEAVDVSFATLREQVESALARAAARVRPVPGERAVRSGQ